jgi:gluconolactonase
MLKRFFSSPNLLNQTLFLTACFSLTFLFASCSNKGQEKVSAYNTTGEVELYSDDANQFVDENSNLEILASGFSWSEGPLWLPKQKKLIFSDVPENTVYSWSEKDSIEIYLKPSGFTGITDADWGEGANGLILNNENELVLCQHGDRRVAIMNAELSSPEENYETLTAETDGKRFNSPNDIVQASNGDYFFTDPPYGLKDDSKREIDLNGVFKLSADGYVTTLIDSLSRPNGIALSPDESTLYVAQSDENAARYYAYSLDANYTITSGKVLLDVTARVKSGLKGLPDGLKVHYETGYLFATGPGGVLIISPAGELVATINTGVATANCAFNDDQSILYMTAHRHLMRINLK